MTVRKDSSEALDGNGVPAGYGPGNDLAAIQYVGISGISKECQDAILRFIQFGNRITRAVVLSCSGNHCLLLTLEALDSVAVESGFASGYGGEVPHRSCSVLQVVDSN